MPAGGIIPMIELAGGLLGVSIILTTMAYCAILLDHRNIGIAIVLDLVAIACSLTGIIVLMMGRVILG